MLYNEPTSWCYKYKFIFFQHADECEKSRCNNQPCMHGGTCLDNQDGAGFVCQCVTGFSGLIILSSVKFNLLCYVIGTSN